MINREYSVTQKIKVTKQPRGGFLNPKEMNVEKLQEKNSLFNLKKENYHPSIIGLTIDYLTRFMMTRDATKSFSISLRGAKNLNLLTKAMEYLNHISGLNEKTFYSALKLSEFDVAFRADPLFYKSNPSFPNQETLKNIQMMVKNSLDFFEKYGPITKDGFTFKDFHDNSKNGYSNVVVTGDGDFLTKDTLWDFKVSKNPPTKDHTLQLLMYFLMGKKSKIDFYKELRYIGIYNPRLNTIYKYDIAKIKLSVLEKIAKDVIEYNDLSFINEIFK